MKRPFLLFILTISTLVGSLLWFMQSPQFAVVLKGVASRYLPDNMGVKGDFSEFSVKLFPPGISALNPRVSVEAGNILGLPPKSTVKADRIDFIFRPLQAFSGDIRIHEVSVVNGDVQLNLGQTEERKAPAPNRGRFDFHWDELFQIRAEAVSLENVSFHVKWINQGDELSGTVESLRLGQWSGKGGLGYSLHTVVKRIQGTTLKRFSLPPTIDEVKGDVTLNALGLELKSLALTRNGVTVSVVGNVAGNLLNPKGLATEASLKISGSLKEALALYPGLNLKDSPDGQLELTSKIKGDLEKPLETLHAEGKFALKNAAFQKWKAATVEGEARWDASPSGGEIQLKRAILSSPLLPRKGGFQPGAGGSVEIGPAKWTLGGSSPLELPIRFEHAHLHWLVASAIESVYPLDFRISGSTTLNFIPGTAERHWELNAHLSNRVEGFQLDNQRFQKNKPMRAVFTVPEIHLDGNVVVNSSGASSNNLVLGLPHSKLRVNGGIDFKAGFDLRAESLIDLADLGHISENEIRGKGPLSVFVHGPSSQILVDIDADLKDVYYLRLFLGDLKGKLTWEDDPENLVFSQVRGNKVGTEYLLEGKLELAGNEKIGLDVKIPRGNIQEFASIFSNLTKDLSWFPNQLNGPVSGELSVRGGLDLSKLQILGYLNGRNWENWQERFKTVRLEGGYDQGRYVLNRFDLLKRFGRIFGNISHDPVQGYQWKLETSGLTVADWDHIAQLDVPIRGKVNIASSGETQKEWLSSTTQMDLSDFTVRGMAMPPSRLTWTSEKGIARVQGHAMGGQGHLDMEYNFNSKEPSYVRGELRQLDFTPVLLILNPRSIQDRSLMGSISGAFNLNFHAGEAEKATGELAISEYLLARSDTKFLLGNPLSFKVQEGNFEFKGLTMRGRTGEVSLELKGKDGQLSGAVKGNLDSSIMEFFTETVTQANGTLSLDLGIHGKLKEPVLSGKADLSIGSLRIASLDSPFENVNGTLHLKQNTVDVQRIHADMGGGRVTADGRITLFPDRYPEIDLKGTVKDSKVKFYPFQFAKVSGSLGIQGDKLPYLVDGKVSVDSALSKEKFLNQKQGSGSLKVLQYAPLPGKQGDTGYSRFKLNIEVDAPRGIMIENDLFRDVQVRGQMKLVNTLDVPRVLGTAEIIQGKLLFKDHIFQIQNAVANFDTPTEINPRFDLNATTEVNNVKIQMYASGRKDKMKIEFNSNPAMAEAEIFSLLAMGLTSNDARKLSATDLSAVQQGEAASLVLHSLDFNRDLEDKTGFHVQLDESVNTQQGVSAFRPQSQVDSAAAPQITIRRKIGDRLSLSAGKTFGTGTVQSNQANLDLLVNQNLSITGVFNNYGTSGAADTQVNQQNSWGLDLKFQKRFK